MSQADRLARNARLRKKGATAKVKPKKGAIPREEVRKPVFRSWPFEEDIIESAFEYVNEVANGFTGAPHEEQS